MERVVQVCQAFSMTWLTGFPGSGPAPLPPPCRLFSPASAPEFGELLGKGSALVATGSSGGRTQRQIHRVGAEHVLGGAVREDGFDPAAACAEVGDLCCEVHAPVHRSP